MVGYDEMLGAAAPELDWVPSPNYLLRRAAIFEWMHDLPAGRVLEIGCGAGAILCDLARLGFTGIGVETSEAARAVADRLLDGRDDITITSTLPENGMMGFDYLMAFEVLEHIERDEAVLADWTRHLKSGGLAFLSLPAHRKKWNATDVAAGHFRRYDRCDVVHLVEGAGLQVERLGSCGWPASRLIEWLRLLATIRSLRRRNVDASMIALGDGERTAASGVARHLETRLYPLYSRGPGRWALRVAIEMQRPFYNTGLGISFLVLARKP